MMQMREKSIGYLLCVSVLLCALAASSASAGQGCPFDDGSCQTYCNQQGCNFGYCGHFAWIQCICRKCGDEWNWYDKVHYNPDKQVNQTELDSLKLNGSAPIILTNNNEQRGQQAQRQQPVQQVQPLGEQAASRGSKMKAATLTTLLIPDLSDSSKFEPNDIPDENSEKFLDFLAKNHEKLAQISGARPAEQAAGEANSESGDEETVEIQISSSNNQQPAPGSSPSASAPAVRVGEEPAEEAEEEAEGQEERQTQPASGRPSTGPVTRLLRMVAHERLTHSLY